jgi:ATP-binding cassette subfamily B protein
MRINAGLAAPDDQPGTGRLDYRLFRRFVGYVRPHWRRLAVALTLLALLSVVQVVQPWLVKEAIDGPIRGGDLLALRIWVIAYLATLIAEAILRYAQIVALEGAGQRVLRDLRAEVFGHITERPMAFFDRNPVGRLITRVTSDVETLNELFNQGVVAVLGDLLKMVLIAGVMLYMAPALSLVAFGAVPLLLTLTFFFRARIRRISRRVRLLLSRLNVFLAESLAGMEVTQLFAREARELRLFRDASRVYRDAELRGVFFESVFSALVEYAGILLTAGLLWFAGGRILSGAMTFGALVAFIDYMRRFFEPLRDLSTKYAVLQTAMASAERVFAVLDDDCALPQEQRITPAAPLRGRVEFDHVSFSYRPREPVIRDVSFVLEAGERVAIVGATGSGKSTLIRLLARLYDVEQGTIRIDGIDIRHLDPAVVRATLGVVTQDVFLFTGEIGDNIALGAPLTDPDPMASARRAAELVGLNDFLQRRPGGMQAPVWESGANLSAGERQLITFARALARDPRILILDEATASVDPATEHSIQEAIHELLAGRTAIVVAHRLSTVREVDRILVLHRGALVEVGSHEELLSSGGIYARLHRLHFNVAAGTHGGTVQ